MMNSGFDLDRMIAMAIDLSAEKDFDRLMQKILLIMIRIPTESSW